MATIGREDAVPAAGATGNRLAYDAHIRRSCCSSATGANFTIIAACTTTRADGKIAERMHFKRYVAWNMEATPNTGMAGGGGSASRAARREQHDDSSGGMGMAGSAFHPHTHPRHLNHWSDGSMQALL